MQKTNYRPNYMITMRGKKYVKQRTGKRTPHHDIFVVRYRRARIHVQRATHTISGTNRKHTSRSDRVIGFARCHSSTEPSFFLFFLFFCCLSSSVDTATRRRATIPLEHRASTITRLFVAWWGWNYSLFSSSTSSIDWPLRLVLSCSALPTVAADYFLRRVCEKESS